MKHKLSILAKERKLQQSGVASSPPPNHYVPIDNYTSIDQRIKKIISIIQRKNRPATHMIFFVMYDITSNKVRTLVAKYLEQKGCTRIQRSIYLADLPSERFENIKNDLAEVQAAYENTDSILLIPISASHLDSMRIIGKDINVELITHTRNTLIF